MTRRIAAAREHAQKFAGMLNMGECWNTANERNVTVMDRDLMEKQELRAIANYFRGFHGADSFVTALEYARKLTAEGHLVTAAVWNQIAEEISHIETNDRLERCLKRD
jgi:hypothetical protein